jgi:ABC-type sulfate/molybdate transport systems ATPase subunit
MLAIAGRWPADIKLLLLDEPYEGLAPVVVQEIERTLMKAIKRLGMTTIIVEQNAVAALHLADRAIILDMGEVVFDGTAQEVLDNEDIRQEYLAILTSETRQSGESRKPIAMDPSSGCCIWCDCFRRGWPMRLAPLRFSSLADEHDRHLAGRNHRGGR